MNIIGKITTLIAIVSIALTGYVNADVVQVGDPNPGTQAADKITTTTVWTANHTYDLKDQIYVMPGATLIIEAGTVVASDPTGNGAGSLAVCRGARIYVEGTAEKPVIMTTTNDTNTWTNGDPKTGHWRETCNEWGNLTIMGNALVGVYNVAGHTEKPAWDTPQATGLNQDYMEGLLIDANDPNRTLYGGNDDCDNSGSIHYISLRYGGRVVTINYELNGLSMGGVGRGTDVDHVDIMNNVDDGIETWGGTVNYKYVSIWNIGDDCFDTDQGWRGKAQFGLLVQGYCAEAKRGSGAGDKMYETDGAEDSDAQPVSTECLYNFTAIGQPYGGSVGTGWRDGARAQYNNCIFMDLGDVLVKNNGTDGELGHHGYGYNGTLTFDQCWTTASMVPDANNRCCCCCALDPNTHLPYDFNNPHMLYKAQVPGYLIQITDSVFYDIPGIGDVPAAIAANFYTAPINNVMATAMPIKDIQREAYHAVGPESRIMANVTYLDPRAANDAVTSVSAAPAGDCFFVPAKYRGAFNKDDNWLVGWTAAYAYGMTGLKGDLTSNDTVNFQDFSVLANNWLKTTQQ
jgi:hypothetical protein